MDIVCSKVRPPNLSMKDLLLVSSISHSVVLPDVVGLYSDLDDS